MFQNYIKYESSIRDNIRYGDNRVEMIVNFIKYWIK